MGFPLFANPVKGSILLFVVSFTSVWWLCETSNCRPVILLPGFVSTRLTAKIKNIQNPPNQFCIEKGAEFCVWVDIDTPTSLLTLTQDNIGECYVYFLKLEYNNITRTTSDAQGVTISVPGEFGDTSPVETLYPEEYVPISDFVDSLDFLNVLPHNLLEVFRTIKRRLQDICLKDENIRGAGYDWRKGPNEHKDLFWNLKTLVEKTYNDTGHSVVLIAHSMGCPMALHFLRLQSQEWKDRYIKSFISLAGVYGGAVDAMKAYIEGTLVNFLNVASSKSFRNALKTMPALAFLLPHQGCWKEGEVLVSATNRNYTVYDMKEFFYDLNLHESWEMYKDVLSYTLNNTPPGVEVHCLHGIGVPTDEVLQYQGSIYDYKSTHHKTGDGDGIVNLRSLEVCKQWVNSQKQKVYHVTFPHITHFTILTKERVLDYISKVVKEDFQNSK